MPFPAVCRILRLKPYLWNQLKLQHNKARFLLLPEVPADTAETNSFLRSVESQDIPDFGTWPIRDAVNGCAKLGLEYEGWLSENLEELEDAAKDSASSFSSLIEPLEEHIVPADKAWRTLFQQYAVLWYGNKNLDSHIQGLQKMMLRLAYCQYSTPELHKRMKNLILSDQTLDQWQRRLIDHFLLECYFNGLDLTPHKRHQLGEIREFYDYKKSQYLHHLANSSVKLGDKSVEGFSDLHDAPEHIVRVLADQPEGPIRLPFSIQYSPRKLAHYLQYCKKRFHRLAWWGAVNSRAAFAEDHSVFNNSIVVEEMRQVKEREAKWLGHKTYSNLQLSMCMANLVEVKEMLTKFGEKASDSLDAVFEDMCKVAEAEGENVGREPPDAWDLPYYARRVANEKYKLNQHQFAEYFPYPQTMQNILKYVGHLFNIKFSDVSKSTPRWHPSVEAYEVRCGKSGECISHLFIDPYSRNGKSLVSVFLPGRSRSDVLKVKPFGYLNLTLTPPTADKPSLIYLDQLSTLAFELGSALQFIMSSAPYSFVQGDKTVEWDCKHVCARVMELLIAGRPETLVNLSHHYQNGQKIDSALAERHMKGYTMTNLPAVVREVVDSEMDTTMYSTRLFWRDVYRDLHAKYLPYKWDKRKGDEYICNFQGYATEHIAAKYYSVLWAKKLASDIVEAFEEAKGNEEAVLEIGKRYADVYLTNGGKYPQAETFVQFRGRGPILEPMIKFYASIDPKKS